MNEDTEFLSKSLVGVGVFLAIPAVLSLIIIAAIAVPASPLLSGRLPSVGELRELVVPAAWTWLCLLGLFLLWRVTRFVRSGSATPPRWLWPSTTIYLLAVTTGTVGGVVYYFHHERGGNFDSVLSLFAFLAALIPGYALVLSFILWTRQAFNRNAKQ